MRKPCQLVGLKTHHTILPRPGGEHPTSTKRLKAAFLSQSMMQEAIEAICKYEQRRFLSSEIRSLECSKTCSRSSRLRKLDPMLEDGLLRVGGRLEKANIPYGVKHPLILPSESPISKLILISAHQKVGHLGKNSILAETRQTYWIIRAGSMIRQMLSRCVICRRYRAKGLEQKMADLPADRTIAGEPPFSRVGVDYFGPFLVKRGRGVVKRYGVVFTCLSIRAIHLEVASSPDTDSCINMIQSGILRSHISKE